MNKSQSLSFYPELWTLWHFLSKNTFSVLCVCAYVCMYVCIFFFCKNGVYWVLFCKLFLHWIIFGYMFLCDSVFFSTFKKLSWNIHKIQYFTHFYSLFLKLIYFLKLIFNWRIIALQYYVGFCHKLTWISHRYTYVPFLLILCLLFWVFGLSI